MKKLRIMRFHFVSQVWMSWKRGSDLITTLQISFMVAVCLAGQMPKLQAQGLSASTPAREYLYSNGRLVAIEEPVGDYVTTVTPTADGSVVVVPPTTVPGQKSRVTFQGIAGQEISFSADSVTGDPGVIVDVYLTNPDGSNNGGGTALSAGQSWFSDARLLPVNGTYTIWVSPRNNLKGGVTLTVYLIVTDLVQNITPTSGGTTVVVGPTTIPGQNAKVTFTGTAGQRISFLANSVTGDTGVTVDVYLTNPDGSPNGGGSGISAGYSWFSDIRSLTVNGTYTIWVNPRNNLKGGATLKVYLVPADTSQNTTPTSGGATVVVPTTTVPGQNAKVTFTGTAAQRISFLASTVTGDTGVVVDFSLTNPDGTSNGGGSGISAGYSWFSDVRTLPANGTYTIWVNPRFELRGGATLKVYLVPADISKNTTPTNAGATVVVGPTTVPGQNAKVTFTGTAGQRISFLGNTVTGDTGVIVDIYLANPDGSQNGGGSGISAGYSWFSDIRNLPTNGTYTIWVNPRDKFKGGVTLKVYLLPADTVQVTTPSSSGSTVVVPTTTVPGQNAQVTFTGTTGQSVSFVANSVTGDTGVSVSVYLTNPDGSQNGGGYNLGAGDSWSSGPRILPSNGTYTIWVNPRFELRGGLTLVVSTP